MKRLLLHSCCGPCSTHVINELKERFSLAIYYFNPNIFPQAEYQKRLEEQKRYAKMVGIEVIEGEWKEDEFLALARGHELDPESGDRCKICFEMRLRNTAKLAKERGFDMFATTLSVSPHKNTEVINAVGKKVASEEEIEFLPENFKKKDGYLKSIRLAKDAGLYRQNYCGCRFSIRKG